MPHACVGMAERPGKPLIFSVVLAGRFILDLLQLFFEGLDPAGQFIACARGPGGEPVDPLFEFIERLRPPAVAQSVDHRTDRLAEPVDFQKVLGAAGGGVAAPIWTKYMQEALAHTPVLDFQVPDNIVFVNFDPDTGKLATSQSENAVLQPFIKGTEPQEYF